MTNFGQSQNRKFRLAIKEFILRRRISKFHRPGYYVSSTKFWRHNVGLFFSI